jgi:hypothetical protein
LSTITYDDIEKDANDNTGWGSFQSRDGASDAVRMSTTGQQQYIHQDEAALRIRDDSGVDSSVFQYQDHDVREYSDLRVQCWYYPRNMGNSDGFVLEYSSDGGTSWNVTKDYRKGRDFENGEFYTSAVVFSSTGVNFQLTSRGRIRFRCDASIDTDWVYIDEVLLQGNS